MYPASPRRLSATLLVAALLFAAQPLHANYGWPGMHLMAGQAIALPTIGISLLLEAWILKHALQLHHSQAFWMSIVANGISCFAGLLLPVPDGLIRQLSSPGNMYVNYLPAVAWLFTVTYAIEVTAVRLLYDIPLRKLWAPLAMGNLITHAVMLVIAVGRDAGWADFCWHR
ncbi:MAG: hypothetical protein IT463_04565 [Planctomycetes bacterium]|nr:hypothetical protein [Planctomycetota bacterium]